MRRKKTKQWLWFVLLWLGSVSALFILSYVIRLALT